MSNAINIQAAFETQHNYWANGTAAQDGSAALGAGRTAGLASEYIAQVVWGSVPAVVGMPTFTEFRTAYEAHPEKFAAFAHAENFPAGGTAFSNAAGSYAYALDNAARGHAALAGGEAQWAGYWGAQALTAGGFLEKAKQLNDAIVSGAKLETVKAQSIQ